LFHGSPAVMARPHGWAPAEGHSLGELKPAPIYEDLWKQAPRSLIDLLKEARCRPVRQWATHMIRRDHGAALAALPLDELFALVTHEDPELVELAADVLRARPELASLEVNRWLALLETPNPTALEVVCELITTHVRPERVTFAEVVQLAGSRPLPVARLGFSWLQSKKPSSADECRALL